MIRYRGDRNFSRGGDDIICYILGDNDKLDIQKTGRRETVLFTVISHDGEVTFEVNGWEVGLSDRDDYVSTSYVVREGDRNLQVRERLRVNRFQKIYENGDEFGCL